MGKKQPLDSGVNVTLVDILLASIIFAAPFFRGLYFEREFLFFHILTAIAFAVFGLKAVNAKRFAFFKSYPDIFAAGLALAYFLSLFTAANLRLAVAESMKMLTYLLIYWLAAYGIESSRKTGEYLKVLFSSGVVVSLLGLGAAFGTFNINAAVMDGIITSTLQYKNTLGIFLVVMNLAGFYLWASAKSPVKRYLYAAANLLIFITLLGTQSRGAWLVYPAALAVMFAGWAKAHRGALVKSFLVQIAAAAVVVGPVFKAVGGRSPLGWLWLLAGILLVIALEFAAGKIPVRYRPVSRHGVILSGLLLVVIIIVFALQPRAVTVTARSLLPAQLTERVQSINLNVHQVQERFAFYNDAFKVVRENPLTGIGGRGWRTVYQAYQSYGYTSREIHSYYLKVLVETGIFGLLMFLGWIIATLVTGLKNVLNSKTDADRSLNAAITAAVLALAVHSIIDFNLSLGAMSILLWSLAGMSVACCRANAVKSPAKRSSKVTVNRELQLGIAGLLVAVLILVPGSFAVGRRYAARAVAAMSRGDLKEAQRLFDKAQTFDPLTGSYKGDLAQIAYKLGRVAAKNEDRAKYLKTALEKVNAAVALDPYNKDIHYVKAEILAPLGQVDRAIAEVKQGITLTPYVTDAYTKLAKTYLLITRYYAQKKDYAGALKYLQEAVKVDKLMKETMDAVEDKYLQLWVTQPRLTVTPELAMYLGEAYALLGSYPQAVENLKIAATEESLKADALMWWGVCLKELGQEEAASGKLRQAFKINPDLKLELGVVQNMIREFGEVR